MTIASILDTNNWTTPQILESEYPGRAFLFAGKHSFPKPEPLLATYIETFMKVLSGSRFVYDVAHVANRDIASLSNLICSGFGVSGSRAQEQSLSVQGFPTC